MSAGAEGLQAVGVEWPALACERGLVIALACFSSALAFREHDLVQLLPSESCPPELNAGTSGSRPIAKRRARISAGRGLVSAMACFSSAVCMLIGLGPSPTAAPGSLQEEERGLVSGMVCFSAAVV